MGVARNLGNNKITKANNINKVGTSRVIAIKLSEFNKPEFLKLISGKLYKTKYTKENKEILARFRIFILSQNWLCQSVSLLVLCTKALVFKYWGNKMAHPRGVEPLTSWSVVKYSIQLSYGCMLVENLRLYMVL